MSLNLHTFNNVGRIGGDVCTMSQKNRLDNKNVRLFIRKTKM